MKNNHDIKIGDLVAAKEKVDGSLYVLGIVTRKMRNGKYDIGWTDDYKDADNEYWDVEQITEFKQILETIKKEYENKT